MAQRQSPTITAEHARLVECPPMGGGGGGASASHAPGTSGVATHDWRKWGPYVSERQWGTVREDYSADGSAWEYFPFDHARSRAYRWGEDGIAGFSDDHLRLCMSIALWNGRDPILKERLFGLTNRQGNHGEDVKEQYYYLDATPTHSYLKFLYKYPQREFPYKRLIEENARRAAAAHGGGPEFELLDTGIFDDDRYFDVFVEYAKGDGRNGVEDVLVRVTAHNRGLEAADLHLLGKVFFRNTWSWSGREGDPALERPELRAIGPDTMAARHPKVGDYTIAFESPKSLLFCENETNLAHVFGPHAAPPDHGIRRYVKDGLDDYVVRNDAGAVNPARIGTIGAGHWVARIPAGGRFTARWRLTHASLAEATNTRATNAFKDFDNVFERRRAEADEFYAELQRGMRDADAKLVHRQALAGMIWSKQFYRFDVERWLKGDDGQPPPPHERLRGRNSDWSHIGNAEVLSMPDKWEYPWYAAWDLAFHCIPLALIDPEFAKEQLIVLTREWYMHPNGQLPAYEWAFGDVNPPVHAWAAWRVFQIDRKQRGDHGDLAFLERVFHKLMLNFTWWVNRKDAQGRNIFQGGFLGLDNIGVFDRSAPLPTGGHINQADGTSWMAMYSLNLMRIALQLAVYNPVYEDIATKFFEHFLHIAEAMTNMGGREGCDASVSEGGVELWDEADEFYYDVLTLPDGRNEPLKLRSMVGLIPLFAVETLEPELLAHLPAFSRRVEWVLNERPDLAGLVSRWKEPGRGERRLLSLLRGHRMKRLLRRMLDQTEFLSDYGVRAMTRAHEKEPYVFRSDGIEQAVRYAPAESETAVFGGNSNWRGPIWMPVNYLIIESLQKFHHYYSEDFLVECPTGSGRMLTLEGIADELGKRLARIFLRDPATGRRAVFGENAKLQNDPHFRDHVLFYEYFHGDNGRGVGASHQTGWTGLIAKLLRPRREERASAREQ